MAVSAGSLGKPNLYFTNLRAVSTKLIYLSQPFCVRNIETGMPKTTAATGGGRPTTGQLFPRSK